jgi:hypothetical protein
MKDSNQTITFRDLDKVKFIIKDAAALDVAYAYEDLVFSEDAVFIIQYHETNPNYFYCWFNIECYEPVKQQILTNLSTTARLNKLEINYAGTFELLESEAEGETFKLKFMAGE